MTQEDIIKELEAIQVEYLKRGNEYSLTKTTTSLEHKRLIANEGSKITTYIVSDISQLLTKIKQQ